MKLKFRIPLLLMCLMALQNSVISQNYNPNFPPNTFRSDSNPYYWKNKLPYPGYWQQDVYYKIKASIDEKTDIISGTQSLTYWNNSRDTIYHVFFHLYQNAFQPGSYHHQAFEAFDFNAEFGAYEKAGLGTQILDIKVDGKVADTILDNTILKVILPKPLPPNDSTIFDMAFKTYFDKGGNLRRRMKMFDSWGYKHYDGVLWYPRISVYDRKFGWTTDQHIQKEFYGDFGTFDVELEFANNYVVEATGNLLNREDVMPDSLRAKLDVRNFLEKPWNSAPSVIIPYSDDPATRKKWHFYAENVHDFAFTADPTYRIGEVKWNDIIATAVVQEPHAMGWWNGALFGAQLIKFYSERIGMYAYPKIVLADAADGMEYSMITLNGGFNPFYKDLLAHEVGHQWFHTMVGNNETYRAFLDEGFTQFIEVVALENISGKYMPHYPATPLQKKFSKKISVRDAEIYLPYIKKAIKGQDDVLNTHSNKFENILKNNTNYSLVYFKAATMLFNLQYVLGEELFWKAFSNYFNQWKMAHPYPEDFRNSFIQYTGVDLNWFFDQWLDTDKKIDYAVSHIKKGNDNNYEITFRRKGEMEMPLDFSVFTTDSVYHFHIPNTWFVKETDATVLPKWTGWDILNKEYTATVELKGKIKNVIIDPTQRLADVDMLNNSKKVPIKFEFDGGVATNPDWKNYIIKWRPDLWYNAYDGIKAGIHFEGDYMQHKHIFSFTGWYNTGLLQGILGNEIAKTVAEGYDPFSFIASYRTAINSLSRKTFFDMQGRSLAGINMVQTGIESQINQRNKINFYFKAFQMSNPLDTNYRFYPEQWEAGLWNNSLNAEWQHTYRYKKGNGTINIGLRSASLFSDYQYNYAELEVINRSTLGKFDFNTRTYGRYGTGSNLADASALYFAGANPEELQENKFTRARRIFPQDWTEYGETTNHFQYGGGLNMRGYAGYLLVEEGNDSLRYNAYKGPGGFSLNAEVEFDKLFNFNPRFLSAFELTPYLFGDAGAIVFERFDDTRELSQIRLDAGAGAALTIKRFWKFETIKPLTIRFDVPFYLSHTPFAEEDNFKFRWIIGINRTF